MNGVTFANPEYFLLLLFVPLMIFWYWRKERRRLTDIKVSSTAVFRTTPRSLRLRLRHLVVLLRILALVLVVVALARPRSTSRGENVSTEGIDIVMTTDISGSMLAEDFIQTE
jgi:Ca-activated chloride channel family protein